MMRLYKTATAPHLHQRLLGMRSPMNDCFEIFLLITFFETRTQGFCGLPRPLGFKPRFVVSNCLSRRLVLSFSSLLRFPDQGDAHWPFSFSVLLIWCASGQGIAFAHVAATSSSRGCRSCSVLGSFSNMWLAMASLLVGYNAELQNWELRLFDYSTCCW